MPNCGGSWNTFNEDCLRHPALRVRDPGRVRVSLPPDRRAARGPPRRRGADDLRPRLHHLEQRVPGGRGPRPGRHRPAVRRRPPARHRGVQPLLGLDLQPPARARGRARVARAAGAVVPGARRVPRAAPRGVRRADLLHVSLRPDRARPRGRAREEHPRAHCARRAGHPPGDLPGDVRAACRHRLQHRGGAPLPERRVPDPRDRRGDGGVRRRPAAAGARPRPGAGRGRDRPRRGAGRRLDAGALGPGGARRRRSGAATRSTARSPSTAGASRRARGARSSSSTSARTMRTAGT